METTKPYGIIYKATNVITGQCYIGKTVQNLSERQYEHYYDMENVYDNNYFHNAIRKYGIINFVWEEQWIGDVQLINIMETFKIMVNHSHKSEGGYNLTWGSEGGDTFTHNPNKEEIRKKISEGLKQSYKEHPERKQNHSESQKKRYEDPEERRKQSDIMKIKYEDPEERQKHSIAGKLFHKNHPEVGKNQSERQKKRYEDPEEHRKQSERSKIFGNIPEVKQKRKESMDRYYKETPDACLEKSRCMKQYFIDHPESRQKSDEAQRKRGKDPAVRLKNKEIAVTYWSDPESHRKASERVKKRYENPEMKKKSSDAQKIAQNRPEVRQKHSKSQKIIQNKPEVRQKHREKMLGRCWYHNDNNQTKLFFPNHIPIGWIKGRK